MCRAQYDVLGDERSTTEVPHGILQGRHERILVYICHFSIDDTISSKSGVSLQARLLALIQELQNQVDTLNAAATTATTASVVFADTPNTLEVENIIDYKTKLGASIYERGCQALNNKALTKGFPCPSTSPSSLLKLFIARHPKWGGTKALSKSPPLSIVMARPIDIIKEYGQIDEAMLKTQCERFCKAGEADAQSRAKQNNTMVCICLGKSLTASAQAKLLACRAKFTFNGVEYAPLMYKIIMRLTTMDSVATNQTLCENLQALVTFAAAVQGNIDKIHKEFDKN